MKAYCTATLDKFEPTYYQFDPEKGCTVMKKFRTEVIVDEPVLTLPRLLLDAPTAASSSSASTSPTWKQLPSFLPDSSTVFGGGGGGGGGHVFDHDSDILPPPLSPGSPQRASIQPSSSFSSSTSSAARSMFKEYERKPVSSLELEATRLKASRAAAPPPSHLPYRYRPAALGGDNDDEDSVDAVFLPPLSAPPPQPQPPSPPAAPAPPPALGTVAPLLTPASERKSRWSAPIDRGICSYHIICLSPQLFQYQLHRTRRTMPPRFRFLYCSERGGGCCHGHCRWH
jgi:hypothetical protein